MIAILPLRQNIVCSLIVAAMTVYLLPPPVQAQKKAILTEPERFSHVVWDSLLQANVSAGKVWYEGFQSPAFQNYLQEIALARPEQWLYAEQVAFWTNVYNAAVVANVLRYPGLSMTINVPGFYAKDTIRIAHKIYTLESLKDSIRKQLNNPLVHFGLNDATRGAPKLFHRAYRSETVIKQLTAQAKTYLRSASGAILDVSTKTLRLPEWFERYRSDFEGKGDDLKMMIARYLEDTEAAFLAVHRREITVAFYTPDKRLNNRELNGSAPVIRPYQQTKKSSTIQKKR